MTPKQRKISLFKLVKRPGHMASEDSKMRQGASETTTELILGSNISLSSSPSYKPLSLLCDLEQVT